MIEKDAFSNLINLKFCKLIGLKDVGLPIFENCKLLETIELIGSNKNAKIINDFNKKQIKDNYIFKLNEGVFNNCPILKKVRYYNVSFDKNFIDFICEKNISLTNMRTLRKIK